MKKNSISRCEKKCLAVRGAVQINESLIRHVKDRLGHDRRYAIDLTKVKKRIRMGTRNEVRSRNQKNNRLVLRQPRMDEKGYKRRVYGVL